MRRDGRAAECGGLENRLAGTPGYGGSNPPPSARTKLVRTGLSKKKLLLEQCFTKTNLYQNTAHFLGRFHMTENQSSPENPRIPRMVEQVAISALDEAEKRFDLEIGLTPFTMLIVKDTGFIEEHPASEPEESYNLARHTVQNARGAYGYAFCYDGYVDTDEGRKDALICECGLPSDLHSFAIASTYTKSADAIEFSDTPQFIGLSENFMIGVKPPEEEDKTN
jgi:hypothetical protein